MSTTLFSIEQDTDKPAASKIILNVMHIIQEENRKTLTFNLRQILNYYCKEQYMSFKQTLLCVITSRLICFNSSASTDDV